MNTSFPRIVSRSSVLNSPFAKYVKRAFTLKTGGRYLSVSPRMQSSEVSISFSRLIFFTSSSLSNSYFLEITSFLSVKRCLYMCFRCVITSSAKDSPPGHATMARFVGSEYGIIQDLFICVRTAHIVSFFRSDDKIGAICSVSCARARVLCSFKKLCRRSERRNLFYKKIDVAADEEQAVRDDASGKDKRVRHELVPSGIAVREESRHEHEHDHEYTADYPVSHRDGILQFRIGEFRIDCSEYVFNCGISERYGNLQRFFQQFFSFLHKADFFTAFAAEEKMHRDVKRDMLAFVEFKESVHDFIAFFAVHIKLLNFSRSSFLARKICDFIVFTGKPVISLIS